MQQGFDMLIDLTAVDYLPRASPGFEVVYHLRSLETHQLLRLRVQLEEQDAGWRR